jgi:hypothetical protein
MGSVFIALKASIYQNWKIKFSHSLAHLLIIITINLKIENWKKKRRKTKFLHFEARVHLHKLEMILLLPVLECRANAKKSATAASKQNIILLYFFSSIRFSIRSKCFLSFINVLCVSPFSVYYFFSPFFFAK